MSRSVFGQQIKETYSNGMEKEPFKSSDFDF